MPQRLRVSLMLLGVILLTGCSGFRRPAVTVNEAFVVETSDEAVALAFPMDLQNPNSAPLELFEFQYSLVVEGTRVYAGRRAGAATVGAKAAQTVTIPAVIPDRRAGWAEAGRPAQVEYHLTGRVVYNAPNTVTQLLFDTGVRRPKASFSKRGTVALKRN
jgi:LEA14-like dessication related protein